MLVMLKVKYTGVQMGLGREWWEIFKCEINLFRDDWKTNSIWYWETGASGGTLILRLT